MQEQTAGGAGQGALTGPNAGLWAGASSRKDTHGIRTGSNRRGIYGKVSFDFLGYTFTPRMAQNGRRKVWFTNWLPAVSRKAMKSMNEKMKQWRIFRSSGCMLEQLAKTINPVLNGWINYYGHFYKTELRSFMHMVNVKIVRWARRKYKGLRSSDMKAIKWLHGISQPSPNLFAHWSIGVKPTVKTTRAV